MKFPHRDNILKRAALLAKNPNLPKYYKTEETRKKMSAAAKKRYSDPKEREKLSARLTGNPKVGRPRKPVPPIVPKEEMRRARVLKQAAELTKNDATRRRLLKEAEQAELLAAA